MAGGDRMTIEEVVINVLEAAAPGAALLHHIPGHD